MPISLKLALAQVLFVQLASKQASVIRNFPAVIECADAAHGLGGMIISDGGCTTPGDVAKAFGGGADFVMLGGMLAGHEESGGRIVEENGEKFMLFYGMSSESAMKRHVGGVAEYRAAEGKTVKLPLRGPVKIPRVIFWAACVQLVHTLGLHA